jgi:hypothetical protein
MTPEQNAAIEAIRKRGAAAAAAILLLSAVPAHADDLRIPEGMMLCSTMSAAASPSHAGCWIALGGQKVEIIAVLPHYAQMRVWSSNGAETATAWVMRADADAMQRRDVIEGEIK